jgi:hypothetical protein
MEDILGQVGVEEEEHIIKMEEEEEMEVEDI